MLTILLLLASLALVIKASTWLVDGAAVLARSVGVSDLVVGLTIVAFGTSLPELVVNSVAAVRGDTGLAMGNILGSTIANILLILGITALIYPVAATRGTVWKEIPFCLLGAVVVAILPNDVLLNGDGLAVITRGDGLILLCFFLIFMYYVFEAIRNDTASMLEDLPDTKTLRKPVFLIGLGMAGLYIGGVWTVRFAEDVAEMFGVGQDLIGLSLLALGTSMPELATSVAAALKKNTDIAIGNVVGSNIFNLFFVLGVTAVIRPVPLPPMANIDIVVTLFATVILYLSMFVGAERHRVERWEGTVFVLLYAGYLGFRALNN